MGDAINKLKQSLTVPERRQHALLQKETSRMWRNFWIDVARNHGYSNTQIAKEFEISESTVRSVLKPKA